MNALNGEMVLTKDQFELVSFFIDKDMVEPMCMYGKYILLNTDFGTIYIRPHVLEYAGGDKIHCSNEFYKYKWLNFKPTKEFIRIQLYFFEKELESEQEYDLKFQCSFHAPSFWPRLQLKNTKPYDEEKIKEFKTLLLSPSTLEEIVLFKIMQDIQQETISLEGLDALPMELKEKIIAPPKEESQLTPYSISLGIFILI